MWLVTSPTVCPCIARDNGVGVPSSGAQTALNGEIEGRLLSLLALFPSGARGSEPPGWRRDTVSSKQRNHSQKKAELSSCVWLFCFLFKALAGKLCGWSLQSPGFGTVSCIASRKLYGWLSNG